MSPLPDVAIGRDEPLYNIGVVARITSVTMATLRAWERRYNFPKSKRTTGGHRLYSEKDVLHLQWVKQRIEEGMQTAQAINALHHQLQLGNLTLVEQIPTINDDKTEKSVASFINSFVEDLEQSLIGHNADQANIILGNALAVSSPEDIIHDIISPVIANVGGLWEKGKISIADEHFATNYLRQRLLMWMMSGPPPRKIPPVVLSCAPNEWHEGSLLILGAILRRRGLPIAYLGQAVPLKDLASFVNDIKPDMVLVNAMTETSAKEMLEWTQWLPEAIENTKPIFCYGGRVFVKQPEWKLKMPGIYLGDTFRQGLNTIEHLFQKSK